MAVRFPYVGDAYPNQVSSRLWLKMATCLPTAFSTSLWAGFRLGLLLCTAEGMGVPLASLGEYRLGCPNRVGYPDPTRPDLDHVTRLGWISQTHWVGPDQADNPAGLQFNLTRYGKFWS